mmetsp:Transcript_68168/g.127267  ORF Transcript_68168/g.127267 Transcript_68168/m.127267 type:complete len:146 (-) Transcript_68168:80-517(-)
MTTLDEAFAMYVFPKPGARRTEQSEYHETVDHPAIRHETSLIFTNFREKHKPSRLRQQWDASAARPSSTGIYGRLAMSSSAPDLKERQRPSPVSTGVPMPAAVDTSTLTQAKSEKTKGLATSLSSPTKMTKWQHAIAHRTLRDTS